jgi:hypothetical protein
MLYHMPLFSLSAYFSSSASSNLLAACWLDDLSASSSASASSLGSFLRNHTKHESGRKQRMIAAVTPIPAVSSLHQHSESKQIAAIVLFDEQKDWLS